MKRILCVRPLAVAHPSLRRALAASAQNGDAQNGDAQGCEFHVLSSNHPVTSQDRAPEMAGQLPRAWLAQAVSERTNTWQYVSVEEQRDGAHEADLNLNLKELQESWYELGQRYSPVVGWDHSACPASMMLDLTRTVCRWGGELPLLRAMLTEFMRHGYLVQAAIAPTAGAAWAAARSGNVCDLDKSTSEEDPAAALSKEKSSDKIVRYVIAAEWGTEALPISGLRLPQQFLEWFQQLGLETLGQLWRLPREALQSRFGELLLLRMDQFSGQVDEPIVAYEPPVRFESRRTFEHPLQQQDAIEQASGQMLVKLCEQLRRKQRGVIQLDCEWDCGEMGRGVLRIGTYTPSADWRHLARLLQMHWMTHRLPGPLHAMRLRAATTTACVAQQESLFLELRDRQPRALAELIDSLSSRLGRERVVGVQLLAEPQIERGYRYISLAGARHGRREPSEAALRHHAWGIGQRPCRLLVPPVRLAVPDAEKSEGPPASFSYQGRQYHVVHKWGPERLETGWWRGPTIRRDYYRVEDRQGRRFWIFRDLRSAVWFMHAESI